MDAVRRQPKGGDVLHLTRRASVQFIVPILFRVIRVHDWVTYDGWLWLDGYELNGQGEAVARRSLFVQLAGLQWVTLRLPQDRRNNAVPPRRA